MKHTTQIFAIGLIWASCSLNTMAAKKNVLPYKNPNLPVNERVADLLSRMTLEEKVGQLRCTLAWNYYTIKGKDVVPSESFKAEQDADHVGMLWATYRADPWTRKSLSNGLTPELAAKAGNALQRYVMEHSRLGIPLFLAEEAPHGHMAIGTTVFPTGYGMAATFSTQTLEAVGRTISREVRLQGGHISYGPVLDLAREPRWSRVEETYGEDPVLTGKLGAAMVRGLGGGQLASPTATLPTLKHFIAYGTTEGGQNGCQTVMGPRELATYFLPPFHDAIRAGALSVMTSYNSLDGVPSTANRHLLTDVLRGEWGFRGFVVSDLYSIDGILAQGAARDLQDAAVKALTAGVDVDLGGKAYATLADAVRKGMVSEAVVDTAVARVLRMKMEMGLFEHPYVDVKETKNVRTPDDVALALRVARESMTLLENKNQTLPLNRKMKVAVVGPNADNGYNLLGDYTAPQPNDHVTTILEGIRTKLPEAQVSYVKGCAVRDTTTENIAEAVEAARRADVVVAVVGGSSARDFKTSYKSTGAAETDSKTVSDMDCGEGFDRATLEPLGLQMRLLRELKKTGKPLVVVYVEGRPLLKEWAAENADALLCAYYPGGEGGQAVADVLFGDYNPAGRVPVSVPRSVGQLPVYYNRRAPQPHDYVEMTSRARYPFGYGLSYTSFKYDNLRIEQLAADSFKVSFTVTNTGQRDGDEVAQLYLHQRVASTVQPVRQLRQFARVHIKKGETLPVSFILNKDDFSIVNTDMKRVVEPSVFDIMVGASSEDIRLRGQASPQPSPTGEGALIR